jgi:hypothetical protein
MLLEILESCGLGSHPRNLPSLVERRTLFVTEVDVIPKRRQKGQRIEELGLCSRHLGLEACTVTQAAKLHVFGIVRASRVAADFAGLCSKRLDEGCTIVGPLL